MVLDRKQTTRQNGFPFDHCNGKSEGALRFPFDGEVCNKILITFDGNEVGQIAGIEYEVAPDLSGKFSSYTL